MIGLVRLGSIRNIRALNTRAITERVAREARAQVGSQHGVGELRRLRVWIG